MSTTSEDQTTDSISAAALRAVMRQVPAPVTVVTAQAEGQPLGVTIGSFTSVSLRPPLVSFNLAEEARVYALLRAADRFAVHLLHHRQASLAVRFADPELPMSEQFEGVAHRAGPGGVPVLEDVLAVLHCRRHARFPAGDSEVIIGRVTGVNRAEAFRSSEERPDPGEQGTGRPPPPPPPPPLVYHRHGYRSVEAEAQTRSEAFPSEEASSEAKRSSRRAPETPAPKRAKS